jgi:hypothetical protein
MVDREERTRDEERIRTRAYALWEQEGRPEGRADVHWDQARELVAIEENYKSTLLPRNTGEDAAEPIEAVENQGEFPELRDQGRSDDAVIADQRLVDQPVSADDGAGEAPARQSRKRATGR